MKTLLFHNSDFSVKVEYITDLLDNSRTFTVLEVRGLDLVEVSLGFSMRQLKYDLDAFKAFAEENGLYLKSFTNNEEVVIYSPSNNTFSVTSDTQACDGQGGSETHFFLNVLTGVTSVYLEHNAFGSGWVREPIPFENLNVGENDLLFAINNAPPFDIEILIRFVDANNEENISEVYDWTLFSCLVEETLVINYITKQTCNTETRRVTCDMMVTIKNSSGQAVHIWYSIDEGESYIEHNVGIYNGFFSIDLPEVLSGINNAKLYLRDATNDFNSDIYTLNVISCEQTQETSVVLNSILANGNVDADYVNAYEVGAIRQVERQSSPDNVLWATQGNFTGLASSPFTGNFPADSGANPIDGNYYRLGVKDSIGNIIYSNSMQYVVPTSINLNSIVFDGVNDTTINFDVANAYEYSTGNLDAHVEGSWDNTTWFTMGINTNGWISPNPRTENNVSIVIPNLAFANNLYVRISIKDKDGNLIYSNSYFNI